MPTCTKASLVAASAGFRQQTFNSIQQLALEVYFRLKTVAAIGGTDYTGPTGIEDLAQAATDVFRDVGEDQRQAMLLAILGNNATASGAVISEDLDTLKEAIACLDIYDRDMLERMNILLQCESGASKDYPQ